MMLAAKLPDRRASRVVPCGGAAIDGSCFECPSPDERAQSGRHRRAVLLLLTVEVKPPPPLLLLLLRLVVLLIRQPLVSDNLRQLHRNACLPGLVLTKVSMAEEAGEGDNSEASPRRLKNATKNNAAAV